MRENLKTKYSIAKIRIILFINNYSLTTFVSDGTADTILVHGFAAFDLESALLHHASGVVADAVAQLAGLVSVRGDLSTISVEFVFDRAAVAVRVADGGVLLRHGSGSGAQRRQAVFEKLHRNCRQVFILFSSSAVRI